MPVSTLASAGDPSALASFGEGSSIQDFSDHSFGSFSLLERLLCDEPPSELLKHAVVVLRTVRFRRELRCQKGLLPAVPPPKVAGSSARYRKEEALSARRDVSAGDHVVQESLGNHILPIRAVEVIPPEKHLVYAA
jgi:hypothetical protein